MTPDSERREEDDVKNGSGTLDPAEAWDRAGRAVTVMEVRKWAIDSEDEFNNVIAAIEEDDLTAEDVIALQMQLAGAICRVESFLVPLVEGEVPRYTVSREGRIQDSPPEDE